ncbi:hypothetical protein SCOR_29220 [Sulfidibacter corallicola]
MTCALKYVAQVICPSCSQFSFVGLGKIPRVAGIVHCAACGRRFQIDLDSEKNCRVGIYDGARDSFGIDGSPDESYGPYRICKPCCEGFSYDLKSLGHLIRSGIVDYYTPILPPDRESSLLAGEVLQLRKYFHSESEPRILSAIAAGTV